MFTSRFSDCRYFFSYTGCPYSYLLISLGTTKRASCFCCGCHDLPSLMSQLYRNSALMLTGVDDSFAVNVQLHYVWLRASHVAVQCLGATVAPPIISVIQRLIAYLYTHTISHNHMHIHPHTQTHTHTRAQSHTHMHTMMSFPITLILFLVSHPPVCPSGLDPPSIYFGGCDLKKLLPSKTI